MPLVTSPSWTACGALPHPDRRHREPRYTEPEQREDEAGQGAEVPAEGALHGWRGREPAPDNHAHPIVRRHRESGSA